jgi:hypothetical protein
MATPHATPKSDRRSARRWFRPVVVMLGLCFALFAAITTSEHIFPQSHAIAASASPELIPDRFNPAFTPEGGIPAFDRRTIPEVAESMAPEPESKAPEPESKAPEPESKAPEPESKAPDGNASASTPTECNADKGIVVDCTFD